MIPEISRILMSYKKSLDKSRSRYESMYKERSKNVERFYNSFLKNLIITLHKEINDPEKRRDVIRLIKNFFRNDKIKFIAVDGTCYKNQLVDYMIFFGASYAIRGTIDLNTYPPKIKYEKFAAEEDVSMVAYVPIPFAELGEVLEENYQFVSSDETRIDLSSIHVLLMQLAEIYLLYSLAKRSALEAPKLLLWDHSISSILASTDVGIITQEGTPKIKLIGFHETGRALLIQDVIIAYSRPWNSELDIPTPKEFRMYNYVIRKAFEKGKEGITLEELSQQSGVSKDRILEKLKESKKLGKYIIKDKNDISSTIEEQPILIFDNDKIFFNEFFRGSWRFVVGIFEYICEKLFKEKDPEALIYRKYTPEGEKECWLTPDDLRFLIAVGLRALIEECWKQGILFVGVVKDSSTKYFSKNYIGICKHLGIYNFDDSLATLPLPWTDRTLLELLPYIDEKIEAPWSTIEFDSVFMQLHLVQTPDGKIEIHGVRGEATNPERVVLRSLAQFYINRNLYTPLTGHVIFIDRIAFPSEDKNITEIIDSLLKLEGLENKTSLLQR